MCVWGFRGGGEENKKEEKPTPVEAIRFCSDRCVLNAVYSSVSSFSRVFYGLYMFQ